MPLACICLFKEFALTNRITDKLKKLESKTNKKFKDVTMPWIFITER